MAAGQASCPRGLPLLSSTYQPHTQLCLCPLGKCGALRPCLFTHQLIPCVPPSGRMLEIYVNIDARTIKIGMKQPCTQSLRFKRSAPEGYHYSLLPPSPIISSAFAVWANTELYILVRSLTNILPVSLTLVERWKYLLILMPGLQNLA